MQGVAGSSLHLGLACTPVRGSALYARGKRCDRRHRRTASQSRASANDANAHHAQDRASWDQITNRLVSSSSIPFSILVLPQVLQNFSYMTQGNMQALSVISWEGYLSGLLGNTLMCSHFANSGENSAVVVQLIGILNNMAVLAQVAFASCMPKLVFLGVLACVLLAVAMSLARLYDRIPVPADDSPEQLSIWQSWQLVSGIFGLSVVPQVLFNVLCPGYTTYLPFVLTLIALTIWFIIPGNRVDKQGRTNVEVLPGMASTLLFALSPLPQLVRNFVDAGSLEGLSVGTMLLALLGNALMVPRALFVRDRIWQVGTCWACLAGWGQLLSMFLRTSPQTGLKYVQSPVFVSVTAALVLYFGYVLRRNARVSQPVKEA